ncbi:MAG: aryl-sulfate sulfotransferase [Candidatus Kapabacteria bacterium]|nr:aryl-sulfate sulfotransferase [Candidatus Kapabacteria bacterium]
MNSIVLLIMASLLNVWEFPTLTTNVQEDPSPGYYFVGPYSSLYLTIIDNGGHHVFDKLLEQSSPLESEGISDFKVHQNQKITYFNNYEHKVYQIDKSFNLIDSFFITRANTLTDFHDFQFLSNGHALLLGCETRIMDLSKVVTNGNPNAQVFGFILQEQDENKNVVWNWNTFDHIDLTDATQDIDFTRSTVMPFHVNSMFEDVDGNLIISCRNLDEIIKINKSNGNIIWIMGGSLSKRNQFLFANDSVDNFCGFSHQHAVKRLANGNLLLIDNGNLKPTPFTRIVEYSIDEVNKIATKVWEYFDSPATYAESMGNVQRLSNGNTIFNWGNKFGEVNSEGVLISRIDVSDVTPYRAYKFQIFSDFVKKTVSGTGNFTFSQGSTNTGLSLNINSISGAGSIGTEKHFYTAFGSTYNGTAPCLVLPYRWVTTKQGISSASGKIRIKISDLQEISDPTVLRIYKRDKDGYGTFSLLQNFAYYSATQEIESDFSGFGEFIIGMSSAQKAVLSSPADNSSANLLNGYLIWHQTSGASSYNVQIATEDTFSNIIFNTTIRDSSSFYYTLLKSNTKYFWRVKYSSQCGESDWSTVRSFNTKLGTIKPSSPADNSKSQQPNGIISWTAVEGAGYYRFQLSTDNNFKSIILDQANLSQTSISYTNLNFNQTYFWRVIAMSPTNGGDWSAGFSFSVILAAPIQNYPPNKTLALNQNDVLRWNAVVGADRYRLQISSNTNFDTLKVDETGLTQNSYTLSPLNYNRTYYWRLKASNAGEKSDWSPVWSFTTVINHPDLKSPSNNASDQSINCSFSWLEALGAITYRLQISRLPDFSDLAFQDTLLTTNYKTVQNLQNNTIYYWRVAAKNSVCISDWSNIWTFSTISKNILAKPSLSSPVDSSSGIPTDPSLIWKAVPNATKYRLQYSENVDFNPPIADTVISNSTSIQISGLKNNKWYYWHTRATNDLASSSWSDSYSFLTALTSPDQLNPSKDSCYSLTDNIFSWMKSESAISYHIQVGEDPLFDVLRIDDFTQNLFYKFSDLYDGRIYYWHIKSLNSANSSLWSPIQRFSTEKIISVEDFDKNNLVYIYPNPFSDKINFDLNLTTDLKVNLKIFDIFGILRINLLNNEMINAGIHTISFPTQLSKSGIYIWKLEINNLTLFGKLIKLD